MIQTGDLLAPRKRMELECGACGKVMTTEQRIAGTWKVVLQCMMPDCIQHYRPIVVEMKQVEMVQL